MLAEFDSWACIISPNARPYYYFDSKYVKWSYKFIRAKWANVFAVERTWALVAAAAIVQKEITKVDVKLRRKQWT